MRSSLIAQTQTLPGLFMALVLVVSLVGICGFARAQTVVFREISYTPLGDAALNLVGTPEAGVLSVENIGSSGLDGVTAELADVCNYSVLWQALPTPTAGDLIRFGVRGTLEQMPGQLLGEAQFASAGPGLELSVDLIPSSISSNQMIVRDGNSMAYIGVIADTGVIATTGTWPDGMSVTSACSDAVANSLSFTWSVPTAISIAGGPEVTGDAIVLGSRAFGSSYSQVDLRVANLSDVVLADAAFAHPRASGANIPVPSGMTLETALPNPFNPRTQIRFSLLRPMSVRLTIHDMQGRLVASLFQGHREAGEHSIRWNGTDTRGKHAASGVYLISLSSGAEVQRQKVALVR